jgi:methylmalonyl-CoA/ethylmalonyl-CoA epimerase
MTTAQLQLGEIGQIANSVQDLSRAVAFYRDVVGLKQIPIPAPTLAFFDCNGIRLMLSLPEVGFERVGSVIYFRVADIELAYRELQSRGAVFMGEPHLIAKMPDYELWMAFFRDPDGNPLALMSEKRS